MLALDSGDVINPVKRVGGLHLAGIVVKSTELWNDKANIQETAVLNDVVGAVKSDFEDVDRFRRENGVERNDGVMRCQVHGLGVAQRAERVVLNAIIDVVSNR